MRLLSAPLAVLALAVSLVLTTASCGAAQDDSKPLLSDEIRDVLEADGPAAAQRRFDEIFPDQADRYEIDMEGMAELAMERMQANDMESGEAVFAMVSTLSQAQMAAYMPEIEAAATAQQEERDAARRVQGEQPVVTGPGPSRDDLKRFAGYYGEPDKQGPTPRNLFALETCDGYLVAGASWGDASPWHLTSVGETTFGYSDAFRSFTIRFEVDESGKPIAMIHDIDLGLPNRLEYLEDAPWDAECLVVERGHR